MWFEPLADSQSFCFTDVSMAAAVVTSNAIDGSTFVFSRVVCRVHCHSTEGVVGFMVQVHFVSELSDSPAKYSSSNMGRLEFVICALL